MSDLAPLLRLAPNLRNLRAQICEGYSESACRDFIAQDLAVVGGLTNLTYGPWSLKFREGNDKEFNVAEEITKALPHLENLDLRSKSYEDTTGVMEFRTTSAIVSISSRVGVYSPSSKLIK